MIDDIKKAVHAAAAVENYYSLVNLPQYLSNQVNVQNQSCIYTATSYPYTPTYTSNSNYVSTQPSGVYVSISSTSQLANAFAQVAGSLLRVTQ